MSNYPERPMRKGSPKSTHKASKKSRSWLQAPGATERAKIENHAIDLRLCGDNRTPDLARFLAKYRNNKVPVGYRSKAGPRPFNV